MTREKAKKMFEYYFKMSKDENRKLMEIINKIYDDFESRICKNCKWFEKDQYGIYCVLAQNEDRKLEIPNEDFGCNRFERK